MRHTIQQCLFLQKIRSGVSIEERDSPSARQATTSSIIMGNSSTKEQGAGRNEQRRVTTDSAGGNGLPTDPPPPPPAFYSSRGGRASRSDLGTFLGISHVSSDRENPSLEVRKETKQEREARKLEKERVLRARERERSMRDEHVDGGYLVTQGVYTGTEDYNKGIVRQLMVLYPCIWPFTRLTIISDREALGPILERSSRSFRIMDRESTRRCGSRPTASSSRRNTRRGFPRAYKIKRDRKNNIASSFEYGQSDCTYCFQSPI